jgi:hypothetical protein
MQKIIESHMSRKFTVEDSTYGQTHITVENTSRLNQIVSSIHNDTALELGETIIKAAGKKAFIFEGRLPNAFGDGKSVISVGNKVRPIDTDPETVLQDIKELISLYNVLVLEAEEKKKREAEEALAALKLKSRRDALAKQFAGSREAAYINCSDTARAAINYAIELEDKLNKA